MHNDDDDGRYYIERANRDVYAKAVPNVWTRIYTCDTIKPILLLILDLKRKTFCRNRRSEWNYYELWNWMSRYRTHHHHHHHRKIRASLTFMMMIPFNCVRIYILSLSVPFLFAVHDATSDKHKMRIIFHHLQTTSPEKSTADNNGNIQNAASASFVLSLSLYVCVNSYFRNLKHTEM